jgi:hypothetical protein
VKELVLQKELPLNYVTLFSELPPELQLRILKRAIPGSRVIKTKIHVQDWLMNESRLARYG